MTVIIGIVCFIIGAAVGMLVTSMAVSSSKADKHSEDYFNEKWEELRK